MKILIKNFFIFLFIFIPISIYAQRDEVNTFYIRKQVGLSLEEHERQKAIRQASTRVSATEIINEEETSKFQQLSNTIKDRLGFVEFTLSTIPAAWQINLHTERTTASIEDIIQILDENPYLLIANGSFQNIIEFLDELQMNLRLLAGVLVVGDDILQMEISDRKKLLAYVVEEFKRLNFKSRSLVRMLRIVKYENYRGRSQLQNYINKDIEKFEKTINGILQ